jgi:hypothetical protein
MALAYEYMETEQEHDEALRVRAREVLRSHRGVLLSLTPDQQRAIARMDPGPAASVGRRPEARR